MILPGAAVAAVVVALAPGCHHAQMTATSGSPPFPVVECYLRHVPDHELVIVNDGSDGDFDAGDVLIGEQIPR